MFLPHFDALCDLLLNERMEIWHLFALYNKVKNKFLIDNVCLCDSNVWSSIYSIAKKQTTTDFQFQNLSQLLERRPLPTLANTKKKKDVICCLYKMKQSHWLLCVAMNCDWSRKITALLLNQIASRGMKTYSEKEARMAQWWERLSPTNESRVRFPDPASYVGWVCCWLSFLL